MSQSEVRADGQDQDVTHCLGECRRPAGLIGQTTSQRPTAGQRPALPSGRCGASSLPARQPHDFPL